MENLLFIDNNDHRRRIIRDYNSIKSETRSSFINGTGMAFGHHGELIQGAVKDKLKGNRRFLVTLPWRKVHSHVNFVPIKNCGLFVNPNWKTKSHKAARLTLNYLGIYGYGGYLTIHAKALPEQGFGSSTSDVVATIRSVADACNQTLTPYEICSIAIESEFACDPIMFEDEPVVFCQREGVIMEHLLKKLPPTFVVGFNTSDSGKGVSTLNHPLPDYNHQEMITFRHLLEQLKIAINDQSVQLLGEVATKSAHINQQFLPKPNFEALLNILNETGACGLQIAHSGNIAGFLLDPNDSYLIKRYLNMRNELANVGIKNIWHFIT
ncbi:hypothetical protein [Methylomonas sp. AM2-LC]|uniref:GHMP family kinase ATP-binding protein n=1 Tax=Methylomonas sp. AM2-LC TaxID=3153301 RepID=UPI003264BEAE